MTNEQKRLLMNRTFMVEFSWQQGCQMRINVVDQWGYWCNTCEFCEAMSQMDI